MRKALLGSIAAAVAGGGLASGQAPRATPPAPVSIAPSMSGMMPAGGPEMMPGVDPMMGTMPSIGYQGGPGAMPPGPMGPGMPMGPGAPMGYPPGMGMGDPAGAGVANRWWFNAEYTLYFTPAQKGAAFVTTSAPADGGLVGNTTTSILHSTTDLGYDLISGFKIFGGVWRDADRRFGWELGGFMSGQKSNDFSASSDGTGNPLLARPFINAGTGAPGALLVSFPTFASGQVVVSTDTRAFGSEINAVVNWYRSCPTNCWLWSVNGIAGIRYLQVEETLNIAQYSNILPPNSVPFGGQNYLAPVGIGVADNFYCANRFYGLQLGLSFELKHGNLFMSYTGKVAGGTVHQHTSVNGTSTIQSAAQGLNASVLGGLYANSSNIGVYTNDEYTTLSESSFALGYNWCSWLSTTIGYNFLYIDKVVRPGDQYTQVVNPSQVPTSPQFGTAGAVPVANPAGSQTYYWLQGVTFGIYARY